MLHCGLFADFASLALPCSSLRVTVITFWVFRLIFALLNTESGSEEMDFPVVLWEHLTRLFNSILYLLDL